MILPVYDEEDEDRDIRRRVAADEDEARARRERRLKGVREERGGGVAASG